METKEVSCQVKIFLAARNAIVKLAHFRRPLWLETGIHCTLPERPLTNEHQKLGNGGRDTAQATYTHCNAVNLETKWIGKSVSVSGRTDLIQSPK